MLPQGSDAHPPCLQQLAQPHPRPLPPILAFLPSPPTLLPLLPLAGRGARVRDAEGERGSRGSGPIGWRGRDRAQSSVLVGRCLVLFLLLIGRQQYLDRARLFTGGHKRGRVSVSRQPAARTEKKKKKNRAALTSGELLHRGKVTTAYRDKQAENTHTHTHTHTHTCSLPYRTNSFEHNDAALCKHRFVYGISQPCCLWVRHKLGSTRTNFTSWSERLPRIPL